MEWITKILEALKIKLRYKILIMLVTAFIIFLPDKYKDVFGLRKFITEYTLYIGLALIGSFFSVMVDLSVYIYHKINGYFAKKKWVAKIIRFIETLDLSEIAVIRDFYLQGRHTLRLPYDHPVVAGLLKKGLLTVIGTIAEQSMAGMLMSMEINKNVEKYFSNELINLPLEENITEEVWQDLLDNRPDFLPEIEHHEHTFHRGWWR